MAPRPPRAGTRAHEENFQIPRSRVREASCPEITLLLHCCHERGLRGWGELQELQAPHPRGRAAATDRIGGRITWRAGGGSGPFPDRLA